MNKEAYLKEVYDSALNDELKKIANGDEGKEEKGESKGKGNSFPFAKGKGSAAAPKSKKFDYVCPKCGYKGNRPGKCPKCDAMMVKAK